MSIVTITYISESNLVSASTIGFERVLVFEASAFDPPTSNYDRVDYHAASRSESTLLKQWRTCDVAVPPVIVTGQRDEFANGGLDLSQSRDYEEFFESAANGQLMRLDASDIGGVESRLLVMLTSKSNGLKRRKNHQKFSAGWSMRIHGNY